MDVMLQNGDTAVDATGCNLWLEGMEEALQQVKLCLSISKGSFIYEKELGLEMPAFGEDERSLKNAEALLREAVMPIEGITLDLLKMENTPEGIRFGFTLSKDGESINSEVTINENL